MQVYLDFRYNSSNDAFNNSGIVSGYNVICLVCIGGGSAIDNDTKRMKRWKKRDAAKVNCNFNQELTNSLKICFDLLKEEDYSDDNLIVTSIKKGKSTRVTDRNFDLVAHELETIMKDVRFDIEGRLSLFGTIMVHVNK